MTDLEITRLCAEAMGLFIAPYQEKNTGLLCSDDGERVWYLPLKDDQQAMALVKRFPMACLAAMDDVIHGDKPRTTDLNRAICECVANLQTKCAP